MIILFHVTKYYGNGQPALHDINLNIKKGEFVFIIGPTGAGKTTLLKLLFYAERPDKGQILIDGKNIVRFKRPDIPYLRRKIGFIFQDKRLLPKRTVFENIAISMEVLGLDRREITKRGNEILRVVGLEEKRDTFPLYLSGGERQKVCIARALVNNPLILLADEPTANLDHRTSMEIFALLKRINLKGTTVVVATHNREIADSISTRVISLDKGRMTEL